MAYFVHNKYDKASIDALAALDTAANTVIDYYGDYETYKYLDTSAGFGKLYDSLSYITPGMVIHDGQSNKNNSHFDFVSSINIVSVQNGIVQLPAANAQTTEMNVNIPTIDPSKALVILNGGNYYWDSGSDSRGFAHAPAILVNIGANTLTLKASFGGTGSNWKAAYCSYQIIEFR